MNKRPISITVFAWIFIVIGVFSFIKNIPLLNNPIVKESMRQSPIPITILYLNMYCGSLVYLVSGIGILKGHNWARFLYFIGSFVHFMINIVSSPAGAGTGAVFPVMAMALVVFFIPIFLLFRPKANEYFKKTEFLSNTESN